MCRAEDERLRAEHGQAMETRAWWEEQQSAAAVGGRGVDHATWPRNCGSAYGQLGVVTAGILETVRRQARPDPGRRPPRPSSGPGLTLVDGYHAAGTRADPALRRPAEEHV